MLRRFFSGGDTVTAPPDHLAAVEKLVKLPRPNERSLFVLRHLSNLFVGDVRGYALRKQEGDMVGFEAVEGYPPELLDLRLNNGPWRDPKARIISNLVAELFTPNSQEKRSFLGDAGIRDAKASMIIPLASSEGVYGALMLHRHSDEPFDEEELKLAQRWGNILGEAQMSAVELKRARQSLVEFTRAFVEAIEARDYTQLGHASRVTAYAMSLGRALGFNSDELADLYFAAMLHDIGKIGSGMDLSVEDAQHPQRGANLVASSPLLANATEGIRSHHENWDGSGFPLGMRREEISLLGRIVAVADTFDLLSSERGQALPIHEVEKGLELRSGRELEPELVNLFINILRQGKSTAELSKLEDRDLPF